MTPTFIVSSNAFIMVIILKEQKILYFLPFSISISLQRQIIKYKYREKFYVNFGNSEFGNYFIVYSGFRLTPFNKQILDIMTEEQSWISNDKQDEKGETQAKEEIFVSESRGGRGGRSHQEQHKATVAEKAEELQPDAKEEENSNWAAEAEAKKDPPARGEGRGNRGNRDDNERRGNQEGGGQFRGRGNRQGQEGGGGGGYHNRNSNRNYEGGGGYNRGGGQNRDRNGGGYGGDRNGGGYGGGDRNGGENHWRRNNDEQGQRGGDNRRGGDGYRGRGRGNFRNFNNDRNNDRPVETKQVKPQTSEIIPNQRKSCPQLVLYIFSAKFSLTLRKLQDFKCKLLIVPFKTCKLQLYPGNLVKQSKANYRQKLEAKEKKGEMKAKGEVYFQKAHQIFNFEAIAFLKIDESDIQGSFKDGFNQIFTGINNIAESDFSSVVFCISKDIDNPRSAMQHIVRNMQQTQKVKNFFINTNSPQYFLRCIQGFREQMSEYISENELYFD